MTENYKVVFDWIVDGDGMLYLLQPLLEEYYVEVYNDLCQKVNPCYEAWNAIAESLGYEGSNDPESEYMKFITGKKTEKLVEMLASDKYNTGYGKSIHHYVDEYGSLHCEVNAGSAGRIDVSFHLVPA